MLNFNSRCVRRSWNSWAWKRSSIPRTRKLKVKIFISKIMFLSDLAKKETSPHGDSGINEQTNVEVLILKSKEYKILFHFQIPTCQNLRSTTICQLSRPRFLCPIFPPKMTSQTFPMKIPFTIFRRKASCPFSAKTLRKWARLPTDRSLKMSVNDKL